MFAGRLRSRRGGPTAGTGRRAELSRRGESFDSAGSAAAANASGGAWRDGEGVVGVRALRGAARSKSFGSLGAAGASRPMRGRASEGRAVAKRGRARDGVGAASV
jgi:hypothetical protein